MGGRWLGPWRLVRGSGDGCKRSCQLSARRYLAHRLAPPQFDEPALTVAGAAQRSASGRRGPFGTEGPRQALRTIVSRCEARRNSGPAAPVTPAGDLAALLDSARQRDRAETCPRGATVDPALPPACRSGRGKDHRHRAGSGGGHMHRGRPDRTWRRGAVCRCGVSVPGLSATGQARGVSGWRGPSGTRHRWPDLDRHQRGAGRLPASL